VQSLRLLILAHLRNAPMLPGAFCASLKVFRDVLQLEVSLIALGRKAQSAIEKLVQKVQQFHLTVNFDRAAHRPLALQELP
jgi:hypothetical protein